MCHNRLLLVGPAGALKRFQQSRWNVKAQARHIDLLECPARRLAFQFESDGPPLDWIREASRHWRTLTFLLDYEVEPSCLKGLAKARRGALESFIVRYTP